MARVYLGLGGNLGDRVDNLQQALSAIDRLFTLDALSEVYETPPKYVTDQPPFLNMAVGGETVLEPQALLDELKRIEGDIGRVPSAERYGPRAIDLDILFYGERVLDTPALTIPHPLLAEREFVLRPLADIAPGLRHPVSGLTVIEMLAAIEGEEPAVNFPIDV